MENKQIRKKIFKWIINVNKIHKILKDLFATVKPVLGDHHWEGPNVVSQGRWSLRPVNQDN